MKSLTLLFCLIAFSISAQIPSPESQISDAVLALDEGDRAASAILGYSPEGKLVVLREGSNKLVCLADDPNRDGFSVACYHTSLEPFMRRGRQLRADGKGNRELNEIREVEAKSGKLKMPEKASTLYVLSGSDKESASLRWVVYIPWATAESTGLPLKPLVSGGPWIMFPGTYRAHIMITPPRD